MDPISPPTASRMCFTPLWIFCDLGQIHTGFVSCSNPCQSGLATTCLDVRGILTCDASAAKDCYCQGCCYAIHPPAPPLPPAIPPSRPPLFHAYPSRSTRPSSRTRLGEPAGFIDGLQMNFRRRDGCLAFHTSGGRPHPMKSPRVRTALRASAHCVRLRATC